MLLVLVFLFLFFILTEQNEARASCAALEDDTQRAYCWQDTIILQARAGNVHEAFETLLELYRSNSDLATDCHAYAHIIGEEAAGAFVRTGTTALSELSSLCGYGFYHGFMEVVLLQTGEVERMRDFCGYVDETLSASGIKGWLYSCYHGIGHGVTDGGDPRAWGNAQEMVQPALHVCADVADSEYLESRCATGAFNALEILSRNPRYKLEDTIGKDPYSVCHAQPLLYRGPCYTNMVIAVLLLYGNDVEKSAQYIVQNIRRPDDPTTMISGTVLAQAVSALMGEFIRIHRSDADYAAHGLMLCRSVLSVAHDACIEGLSYGHIQYGTPPDAYRRWLAFCGSATLNKSERDVCYRYILTRLSVLYTPSVARDICTLAGEPYAKRYCSENYL